MSIFLRKLLPTQPWVLAAISGENKQVRTFRADEAEREHALEWISERTGCHFRVLAGRPNRIISSVPTIDHLAEVSAIGIRCDPAQAKALRSLQNAPGLMFPYQGRFIAVWLFKKPVAPDKAAEAEQTLADRFRGERLNFFVPVVHFRNVEDWAFRFIEPKDVHGIAPVEEDSEELSAEGDPKHRSWALEPIIQRKKTTLIFGAPGMGKSQIALDIAMRVTRGIGLPGQPKPERAGVIICETEDDWDEDVKPRLIAVGADRKLIKGVAISDLNTKTGVARLAAAKARFEAETGLPVGLLVLSPFLECFGTGGAQEEQMRLRLREFKVWEKTADIGTLGVAHPGEKGDIAGPKTFKRAARAVWKVIEDEDTGQRLFVCDKANNTPDDFKLAYRIQGMTIQGGIKTSKIVWEDPDFKPQEARQEDAIKTSTERVAEYLKDRLQDGPIEGKILVQEVMKMGYSEGTAHNAKKMLGIRTTGRGKTSPWALA